jgi:hypothetical protein
MATLGRYWGSLISVRGRAETRRFLQIIQQGGHAGRGDGLNVQSTDAEHNRKGVEEVLAI